MPRNGTWYASDSLANYHRWAERNDEARVRDYRIREAQRSYHQDREDAKAEFRTRNRRRAHEEEHARASVSAHRLNLPPLLSQSSSSRYETKFEAQVTKARALENEAKAITSEIRSRERSQSLQGDLNIEKAVNRHLSGKVDALAISASRAEWRARELSRLNALHEKLCERDRIYNRLILNYQDRRLVEHRAELERLKRDFALLRDRPSSRSHSFREWREW